MWPVTDKRKKKPPKRGAKQAQSLKRRRRLSLFTRWASLVVVCITVIGTVYIWKSGLFEEWMMEASDTVDRGIAEAGFAVGEVRITGQENTELKQVRAALALYDGQSIVSLDLENMLLRVEGLPWVKKATIVRIMPDALEVTIVEHEAVALWQENGQLYLVNDAGKVITDQGLAPFVGLPHVVGVGANENLEVLLAMKAKYPALFAQVKSSVWVGGRRWDMNLTNGIKIKLPEKGPDLAWQKLYEYDSSQKILAKEVLIIDLRQHGKTILRLTEKEAERRRLLTKSKMKEESI
ncbi:MAG: FtsQ-type POTRA domain-containing protein [Emcibacter sp.]|nr:FtsQ-type POTRA domain-containing protein [Emcibacter sp.]